MNDLPSNRILHGAAVVNNVLYLVDSNYNGNNIEKYNVQTKTFVSVMSIGERRDDIGICEYDGESFIVAGGRIKGFTNTGFLYNTRTNKIKKLYNLNIKVCWLVNCLGTVYAIGDSKNIEKLNHITNKWEVLEIKLNIGRYKPRAISHNEFIYVFGRHYNCLENSVEKVNVLTGEVKTIKSSMIVKRSFFGICKINLDIYLIGGSVNKPGKHGKLTSVIEVFNLESEKFTEFANLPFKIAVCTTSVLEIEE